jgi:hypothetical protein
VKLDREAHQAAPVARQFTIGDFELERNPMETNLPYCLGKAKWTDVTVTQDSGMNKPETAADSKLRYLYHMALAHAQATGTIHGQGCKCRRTALTPTSDIRSFSPMRTPDWRWQAAVEHVDGHTRPRKWEDSGIDQARRS